MPSSNSDETFALFSSLMAGIGGILIALILVAIAFSNVQSTANTIVLLTTNGASKIRQVATSLIAEASTVVQSVVPEVEQVASDVGNAVVAGVQVVFNTIVAVGNNIVESVVTAFNQVAETLRDLGQALIQVFLNFFTPFMKYINVQIQGVTTSVEMIVFLYDSISTISQRFIEVFGRLIPDFI